MGIINKVKKDILILFLVLIIVFIITYSLETISALDEFIDDYHNETYIEVINNLIRNPSLNAIELDYGNETLWGESMNIWITGGFTEVDPGDNNLVMSNSTYIWFNQVDRDEGDRIYKDYGSNYFDQTFHYKFRVKVSSYHFSNPRSYFMAFSEESLSIYNTIINDKNFVGFFVQWRSVTGKWEVYLRMWDGTTFEVDSEVELAGGGKFDLDKWYDVEYIRNGDNVTAWFYNDALMTSLDFMLTVNHDEVDNLRYFHPLNSENQVSGGRSMYSYLTKVINSTVQEGYLINGYFYTSEMLSQINGSSVVLLTNTTIPEGDFIKVEFSTDNVTWKDHNGNAGQDIIIEGYEALDLRDLNYLTLYMRYEFNNEGFDSTPRLYQIRVVSSAIGENGGVTTTLVIVPLIVVGLLIGLIIGVLLKT